MIKKIVICFVVYVIFNFQVVASEDKALFWRVDSELATVYLLGSIHFADESFYPLREEIEQAFETSDALVVEVDASSPESIAGFQHLMQSEGSYSGDETLKDNLSNKTYQELQIYLKELGVPSALVEKQKPGMVMLTLAAVQAQMTGLNPEQGIDLHFLRKINHKKMLTLETMDEQIRIFLDIEDADLLLQDSFDSPEMVKEKMHSLISAWKQGDEKSLHKLLFEDVLTGGNAAIDSFYERLYFKRNVKMTSAIKSYLKQKGRYFVVVGAGHLIGDKGIVQLLQNAGYRITRL